MYTRLVIDTPYFAVNLMQRTHLLLSASDMGQCRGGSELQVCPANVAVLNNEIKSCPLSLYLQLGQAPQVCAQELLRSPPNTSLFRHGALVLFYTNTPRRAFFKCRNESQWISSTYTLNGTGLIEGATACHVSVEGVHLRLVLRAKSRFEGPRVQLFVPQLPGLRERTDFKAIRGFVRTPFFRALSENTSSPIPWDHWRALTDTASRLEHSTPSAWYLTMLVSASTALGV
jgi:hypothetical protein